MIVLRVMQYAGHEKELEELLEAVRDIPEACDEVWLPGNYGYPPLETHRKNGRDLIPIADRFRALGIRPSLQISNTLGHGSVRDPSDASADFERMVGPDGRSGGGSFCPKGDNFRRYIREMVRAYCVFHPYAVWVDDDLRMEWHYPDVQYGCFCDSCIAQFNERIGDHLTRGEIVEGMEIDPEFRAQYIQMNRENIADFARVLTEAVMEVSPESLMGWEYVSVSGFGGPDFQPVFDAMYKASGRPPLSRPGHGVYFDHAPRALLDKALNVNYMNEIAPDYIQVRRPEIENCPHAAGGKSIAGTCIESSIELAYGCNGLSYATLQGCCEPIDYHKRMWRRFRDHRAYWQKLIDLNEGTGLGGVSLAFSGNMYKAVLPEATRRFQWAEIPNMAGRRLAEAGLPLSYDRATCKVRLLHPDMVEYLADEDLAALLAEPVMTDGRAVERLIGRGFGDALGLSVAPTAAARKERYLDHPVNRELAGRCSCLDGYGSAEYSHVLRTEREDAEILSCFLGDGEHGEDIASLLLTTDRGGRWAVFGGYLWSPNVNNARRLHLCYVADALCGGALPAYLLSTEQMAVLPRVRKSDGQTVAVSLLNLQIGPTDELEVAVRKPVGTRFVQYMAGRTPEQVPYVRRGEEYILSLKPIPAWEMVTVCAECSAPEGAAE